MANCDAILNEWNQCLATSGRNPSACTQLEGSLRKCGQETQRNFCIDETTTLLQCAKKPGNDACANEFLTLRECNRADGPHMSTDGVYSPTACAADFFAP